MMTKRVTVTVPDDIHEKMEKWKKKFNYSGIFQEAVLGEILKRELFESKMQEDKSLIEIWDQADFDKPDADFEIGREMGFVYAKISPYSEIKSLEEYIPGWDKKDKERIEEFHYDLDISSILYKLGILGEAEKIKLTKDGRIPPKILRKMGKSTFSWDRFEAGFMMGIMEFLKEEVSGIETSFLVAERDKKLRKAKIKSEKDKIFLTYARKFNQLEKPGKKGKK